MRHASDPIELSDTDRGLPLIRWTALGFDELRRTELLSRKVQFELVEGMILHREDATPRHDRVVEALAARLRKLFAVGEHEVLVDHELRLDELDSVVSPDIALVAGGAVPQLVVEVSDTAPRLDAQEKELLYARAGVDEYWHVDLAWMLWQTHTSPHRTGYGTRCSGPPDRPPLVWLEGWEPMSLDELLVATDAEE